MVKVSTLKKFFRRILGFIPYVKFLERSYQNYLQLPSELGHLPGHFYSTIPSGEDIEKNNHRDYDKECLRDIDLNIDNQFNLLNSFRDYYSQTPYDFRNNLQNKNFRYSSVEAYYRYSDVIFLFSIMKHYKPERIIEIGSGHSSAIMLDVNELFFENKIRLKFIEPFPENRLFSILRKDDFKRARVIKSAVQDADISLFSELEENDILFIDSSHVSKLGSDLNFILFQVLPLLKPGVLIHFHDIFYPFELPKHWISERKWFWNENYLLRAFLINNHKYEIVLFNSLLHKKFQAWFLENMPDCLIGSEETGSIWIRKK